MLKRLWLILSVPWAALCLYAGSNKVQGIEQSDIILALLPLVMAPLMLAAGRFVLTGRLRSGRARAGFARRQQF